MGTPGESREEDRRSVLVALGTVAVVFVVAILLGLLGLAVSGGGETHSTEDNGQREEGHTSGAAEVPDVVGMEVHQAGETLEACGLEMTQSGELEGIVTGQHPEPGHKVEKHSEVEVEVGREPPHEEPQVEEEPDHPAEEGHEADEEAGHDSH